MNATSAQVKKVLTGNYSFSQFGFSMLITRLKGLYEKDPSEASLQKYTNEINGFIKKFESIMAADFNIIKKL